MNEPEFIDPKELRPGPIRNESLPPEMLEQIKAVFDGRFEEKLPNEERLAEMLGVSRRTIEAHLRSIYTKLGVSPRVRLALAYASHEQD